MIKANELRLGNYILENGEPSNVYMIDRGGISFYRINDIPVNKETGCTLNGGDDRFKPIPLTTEWLERCGFAGGDLNYSPGMAGNSYRVGPLLIKIKNEVSVYHYEGPAISVQYHKNLNHVIYLHQLQNLYFALTGEELTISHEHLQSTS